MVSIPEQRHAQFQIAIWGWGHIPVDDLIFLRKNPCTSSEQATSFIDIEKGICSLGSGTTEIILPRTPRIREWRIISIRHISIAIHIHDCVAQRFQRVNFLVLRRKRRRYLFAGQCFCTSPQSLLQKRKEHSGRWFFTWHDDMQVIAHNLESENPHAVRSHWRLTNQVHCEDIIFFEAKQNRCLKSWRIDMPIRTAMNKLRFAVCFQISIVAHKLIIILSKVSQVVKLAER